MYTAQNVDKRYPPPFDRYERRCHQRVEALYPCTKQAAAVARGKGFDGLLDVIPLGFDPTLFRPGNQSLDDDVVTLLLSGRLVPEKGVLDAVRVLAHVNEIRPARLVLVGQGPEGAEAHRLAAQLGVADRIEVDEWRPAAEVAAAYRQAHIALVPSTPTTSWTEQFGRVIVEAQASGAVVAGYGSGSIPEVAGDAAVLVPAGRVDELSLAVQAVLADREGYVLRRSEGIGLSAGRTWARVAARQVALYESVREGRGRIALPASPRARRSYATREFGPTTGTTTGLRPFALPVLRKGGVIAEALAAAIDAGAEARATFRGF
jgi:glycosyltransferase involved in cell wall biosynthesis